MYVQYSTVLDTSVQQHYSIILLILNSCTEQYSGIRTIYFIIVLKQQERYLVSKNAIQKN